MATFGQLSMIIREELEMLEDEKDVPELVETYKQLRSASAKLSDIPPILTKAEREAVKYALEDVGECYLHAGTSAGYPSEAVENVPTAQAVGRAARQQAAVIGVYV